MDCQVGYISDTYLVEKMLLGLFVLFKVLKVGGLFLADCAIEFLTKVSNARLTYKQHICKVKFQ